MADSVAITSTCTTKLERFDEIGTQGKRNFEPESSEMIGQFLEEISILLTKLARRMFRETTVPLESSIY